MKGITILVIICAILCFPQLGIAQASFGTFCHDNPAVPNTGFCTLLDPMDTSHQTCFDSLDMQTCDSDG